MASYFKQENLIRQHYRRNTPFVMLRPQTAGSTALQDFMCYRSTRVEQMSPVVIAYTDVGNHASFPSPSDARSAGVQSTTEQ
jgi:hypothetical protein